MIEYSAVTKLSLRLEKARAVAPQVTDFWLHKMVGPALVTEMKAAAPVKSGNLRDHIRQINEPGKVRVGPFGVEYNRFVVEGTPPHEIKPKKGTYLRFKSRGNTYYVKKVQHPGTRPNPYMSVSTKKVMDRMLPKLTKLQIDVIRTGEIPRG